jgi:hypothetical protein
VFWGSCVVFWCSFWVGFWLSESLRGVFTPARNGRLQRAQFLRPEFRCSRTLILEHLQGAPEMSLRGHGITYRNEAD